MRDLKDTIDLWRNAPKGTELSWAGGSGQIFWIEKGRDNIAPWCEGVEYTFAPPPGWHINDGTEPDAEVDQVIFRDAVGPPLRIGFCRTLRWGVSPSQSDILWYHTTTWNRAKEEPQQERIVAHRGRTGDEVQLSIEGGSACNRRDSSGSGCTRISPDELRKMMGVEA